MGSSLDRLEFELRVHDGQPGWPAWTEARYRINGDLLVDVLREIETPYAVAEGHPDLAGDYLGPAQHAVSSLLGGGGKEKTMLLGCTCGVWECWPMLIDLVVDGDTVTWSAFEQPFRPWKYGLTFTFSRREYERVIASLVDRSAR